MTCSLLVSSHLDPTCYAACDVMTGPSKARRQRVWEKSKTLVHDHAGCLIGKDARVIFQVAASSLHDQVRSGALS